MKNTRNKFLIFTLIASLISTALYLALSAVYAVVISNILYLSGALPLIIEALVWFVGIISYAVIFALFIYSIKVFGTRQSLALVFLYCGVILFKNISNTIIQSYVLGIHTTLPDLLLPLSTALLEALLAFIVVVIAYFKLKDQESNTASSTDKLKSTAFFVGILISATKLLPRIIYDIGYGAPANISDLIIMLLAYASDLSIIAIVYFISHFTFRYLHRGE